MVKRTVPAPDNSLKKNIHQQQPQQRLMLNPNGQTSSVGASTATNSSSSTSAMPNPHPLNSLSSGTTPANNSGTNPGAAATASRPANNQYNTSTSSSKQQTVSMGAQQASAQPSTGQYKPAPGAAVARSSGIPSIINTQPIIHSFYHHILSSHPIENPPYQNIL